MQHPLLMEHRRVEHALDRLDALLDRAGTASLAEIVDARRAYARQILTHLDSEDAHVFATLDADPRPDAMETAACFHAERNALVSRFEEHAHRYWTDASIDADRAGYAASVRPLLAAVRCMIVREERLLYPMLEGARVVAAVDGERWLASAWRFGATAPFGPQGHAR